MIGKNLFKIRLDHIVAPKRVLLDQAQFLADLTQGTVKAHVETTRGSQGMDDFFIHTFHITVPALQYSAKLFEVSHAIDIYPVQLCKHDSLLDKECADAEAFETAVAEILNADATKRRLESLLSQACAEMDEPLAFPESSPAEPQQVAQPEQDVEELSEPESVEPPFSASAEEPEEESLADADGAFVEWGDPIDFDTARVESCAVERGAAIIYTKEGKPLFIAYSGNIRDSLKRQLGGGASPAVARSRSKGLQFVCGSVRNIDDAEQIVESRINTMPFRGLLGDSDSNDWG